MPVYWFALSCVPGPIHPARAILIFVLLHGLLYPSSNGYNSYMDRDEGSIGGVAKPMQPTRQLFYVTVWMDAAAFLLAFLVSGWFALALLFYIICSRAYSNRYIRLKRFPIWGYVTVVLNQGTLVFCMVYYGAAAAGASLPAPWLPAIAAAFLIGGFYPITQVYQHAADAADGVTTISMLLGKRGTFIYCAAMYLAAFGLLFVYYQQQQQLWDFVLLQLFFIPVIFFFIRWFLQVWKDGSAADFKRTMQMNVIAGTSTNLAFIVLLIIHQIG
ncbi:1,4-dihydroxy-2-naphthoate octaprenyltransferase [Chitinophaga japonensis]|uniref:1,4-dihydroxy-2-naphthoate octaprenyltransferase n=2 Tax=Chitinophaga japonensis TaxID=104662 RepID=A0A562T8F2_CHIJA|nr:1,4-dihydroxy-2-naphthoate octaprenyltransferase [Chitinophaga japonensis]